MKTEQPKPRITPLTDAAEIESAKRNEVGDINGWQERDGSWWAYSYSVERWRKSHAREEGDV